MPKQVCKASRKLRFMKKRAKTNHGHGFPFARYWRYWRRGGDKAKAWWIPQEVYQEI